MDSELSRVGIHSSNGAAHRTNAPFYRSSLLQMKVWLLYLIVFVTSALYEAPTQASADTLTCKDTHASYNVEIMKKFSIKVEFSEETINGGNGESLANGDPEANRDPEAAECDGLLQKQVVKANGEASAPAHAAENERRPPREIRSRMVSAVHRIKRELNETVCWKIRLWMVIILLFVSMITVILGSMAFCAATHEDEDDKFDPSLFKVPQYFNGSFQMPNVVFTEELFDLSSNKSQKLAGDLQDQLSGLFRSSTALGRYFSKAEISAFRNGSVISEYKLKFVLPEEEQKDLRQHVVSRKMVYNVFRQFLFDRETPQSDPAYIDPDSLVMF